MPGSEAQLGKDLKVPLACPQCGEPGWVQWERLGALIRCNRCDCRFQIGPTGLIPKEPVPPVGYTCPRCAGQGFIPMSAVAKGEARCSGCDLQFQLGADQQLYSLEEWEQKRAEEKAAPRREDRSGWPMSTWQIRWYWLAGGVGAALLATLLFLTFAPSNSPAALARSMTQSCLAGDLRQAMDKYLPEDDDSQRHVFKRWQIVNFASISDRVRPAGDAVSVETEIVSQGSDITELKVTLNSSFFGARSHRQIWRRVSDRYTFDAVASYGLAAIKPLGNGP